MGNCWSFFSPLSSSASPPSPSASPCRSSWSDLPHDLLVQRSSWSDLPHDLLVQRSSWSDLPHDLLVQLLGRTSISYFDLARFAAVCKSWRDAAVAASATVSSLPYVASFQYGPRTSMLLYGLFDQKIRRLKVPHDCVFWSLLTSSHGWLVATDYWAQPLLFNPISGARIDLPRFGPFPKLSCATLRSWIRGNLFCPFDDHFSLRIALSASPLDPNCIAMAIHTSKPQFTQRLSYAKLGDPSWTTFLIPSATRLRSLTYHRGRFWTLSSDGAIFSINLANLTHERFADTSLIPRRIRRTFALDFLVALPSDETILFVRMYHELDDHYLRTHGFDIFKLEGCADQGTKWVESKDIGKYSLLILGWRHSIVLPASDVTQEYLPNCIYFRDLTRDGKWFDIRVFHIDLGTFCHCTTFKGTIRAPVWFAPNNKMDSGI